jgi:hypothetical protein
MRKILLLLALSIAATCIPWSENSYAQLRLLPQNGKRGVTGEPLPLPLVAIGRDTLRMAPGGLIFDGHNRTIVHGNLPVGADVWYQLNNGGEVQRIYILTPYEQSRLDQKK